MDTHERDDGAVEFGEEQGALGVRDVPLKQAPRASGPVGGSKFAGKFPRVKGVSLGPKSAGRFVVGRDGVTHSYLHRSRSIRKR